MADDLCCSICMFRFNESSYLPLWLKCGHTFCKSCLEDISHRGKLKCPNCNSEEDQSSVDSLPKNYFVMEMIVRGLLSRTHSATEEPWTCKLHPTELLGFYAPRSRSFLCSECVKFSNEPKIVNIDKTRTKTMLKPYANFYESASFDDMDTRLAFLEQLESCLKGEQGRVLLAEQQLHDSALLALEAGSRNCRQNVETYYDDETARIGNATGVLKCLRELKELGQGFEIMDRISVAKQMELIPPLHGVTLGRVAPQNERNENKFAYKLPQNAMNQASFITTVGSRLFHETSSGEDVCEYKISRFATTGNRWGIYEDKNQVEAVSFSSSKPVFLTAVGIGTSYVVQKTVKVLELSIILGNNSGGQKIAAVTDVVVSNVDNTVKIAKINFEKAVEIAALQDYTIRLVAKGDAGVFRGQNAQQAVIGSKQVEFTFKSTVYDPSDIKNGDNLSDGPIIEVYYQLSSSGQTTIRRFLNFAPAWICRPEYRDAISFRVDKNAKLNGLSVCSPIEPGPSMVGVEVLEGETTSGKLLYALPGRALLPFSASSKTCKVMFQNPVSIKMGGAYTLIVTLTSPSVYKGASPVGPVVSSGAMNVKFFETVYNGTLLSNGSNLLEGPIAELHFSDVVESENLYGKVQSALGAVDPRLAELAGGEVRMRRFAGLEKGWQITNDKKETLTFQFDRPVLFTGFGLAAAAEVGSPVTPTMIQVLSGNSIDSKVIYASVGSKAFYTLPDADPVHRVSLFPPIELTAQHHYTLVVQAKPTATHQGNYNRGLSITEPSGICTFSTTVSPPNSVVFSGETAGPLIDLFYTPISSSLQQLKDQLSKVLSDHVEVPGRPVLFVRYTTTGSSWHVNTDGKQVEAITFKPSFTGQLTALSLANSQNEGAVTSIKTIELRKGQGTRGELLYTHGVVVPLQRKSAADAFVKVQLIQPFPVTAEQYYTLRVQYEENAVIVRGTGVKNSITEEGFSIVFQRANFEGGDVENGSHETHGPLKDFYFLIG